MNQRLFRCELRQRKASGANSVSDVSAIIAHMIFLSEVKAAFSRSLNGGIRICQGPTLDDRKHQDHDTTSRGYSEELCKSTRIIDMFQDMRANDDIVRAVRKVELDEIKDKIGFPLLDIGGRISTRVRTDDSRDRAFRRKMQHTPSANFSNIVVEP